ncbi:MAG: fibronectin type III domain-containing protein [Anaerostipes sp.]|nr:fibronectin type III domain-containing protein [Anaerostipes sp.]
MKIRKKLVYVVVMLFVVLWCYPNTLRITKAADSSSPGGNITNLNVKKPSGFDAYKSSEQNPYGYRVGEVFRLVTKNELSLYKSNDINASGGELSSKVYDTYNKKDNTITGSFQSNKSLKTEKDQALCFTESVAYHDPVNVQKQNICYVGVEPESGKIYYWIQDSKNNSASKKKLVTDNTIFLGKAVVDKIEDYQANAFLAVTAGDYNGDGKDSIMIAVTTKEKVDIYEMNPENMSVSKRLGIGGKSGAKEYKDYLAVDMTTGDFDGNGVDDLAVATAFGKQPTQEDATAKLSFKYGKKGETFDGSFTSWKKIENGGSDSLFAPGISAGDMDGDGQDEVVVAGMQVKFNESNFTYKDDTVVIACFGFDGNKITVQSYQNEATNQWTVGGVYPDGDDRWQTTGVECFKVNGKASSEYVFINGTIYKLNKVVMEECYTPDYFKKQDNGADKLIITNTYIKSVTSGNLDGNEYGREQVAFVIGLKVSGVQAYYYKLGVIGGDNYSTDKKVGTSAMSVCGVASGFTSNDIQSAGYEVKNKKDAADNVLNCIVTAVDSDEDGTVARYTGVDYAYSDPTVETVLQAAPRFDELGQEAGETTYAQETSYELEHSTSDNVSFSAGVTSEAEIEAAVALKVSGEMGYQLDWAKSFTNTLGESYSTTVVAKSYNSVLIQRTPVYIYSYQLAKNNSSGSGGWNNTTYEKGKNMIQYAIPQKPVYFQLSIDEYNDYVDEYNKAADDANVGKQSSDPTYIQKLKKISNSYMKGNEGDPTKYANDWDKVNGVNLSKSNISLGYNGTSATNEWTTSGAYTEGVEMNHGFHYSNSLMFGVGALGNKIEIGGYTSLDYTHGTSEYSTTAHATTSSGTVNDLDQIALQKEGYQVKTIRGYSFDWNFGKWDMSLNGDSKDKTPVFGYVVSNCTSPAKPPEEIEVEGTGSDTLGVSWKKPTNTRAIDGYNVYLLQKGKYIKQNDAIVTDTKYEIGKLKSNTEYTVVVTSVTSQNDDVTRLQGTEGVWSDQEKATTWKAKHQLDYTLSHATAQVSHLGNVDVKSGDKILEQTVITFDMKAKDGYTLDSLVLKKDGEEKTIPLTGKDMTYSFVLTSDCSVSVKGVKTVDESQIKYGVDPDPSGAVNGIIKAKSGGVELAPPEAAVNNTNVDLEVTPNKGYVVKGWKIDGIQVDSIGQNTLKYYFTKPSHEIYAVLAKADAPEVTSVLTVKKPDHGNLVVKNEKGTALTADKNGKITVQKGSKLTVSYDADNYYSFREWTDDLASFGAGENNIAILVEKDMTLGATFYAPVKYKLTYGAASGGKITAEDTSGNNVLTATSHNPGTKILLKVKADQDYRILKLDVVQGTKTLPVSIKKGDTEYSYPITLNAGTTVQATFEQTYPVTVSKSTAKTTGAGNYGEKDTVTIQAGEKEGYIFKEWKVTGGNITLKDAKSPTTTFVMSDSAVGVEAIWEPHTHTFATHWSKNSKEHWHACTCGHNVTKDKAAHKESSWIVDKAATELLSGARHKECTVCGYVTKRETINPSKTGVMLLKGTSTSKTISLKWSKIKDADGYEIYGAKCSKNYKKIKTIKTNKTTEWTQKKLKKGTGYKYYIRSYKMINGKKRYLRRTDDIHVATSSGKYTNVKKMTGTSSVKTKVGKTKKITIKIQLQKTYRKTLGHVAKVRYVSDNKGIATVSKKGVVTGKKKGTCYIYAYAENGVSKKIKVSIA